MQSIKRASVAALLAMSVLPAQLPAAMAAEPVTAGQSGLATYADLADLADSAQLVVRARVLKLARVENERAPGLRPGWGRFFVKAKTQLLLTGDAPLGESLRYLVDLPLDARGKAPSVKKKDVLLFARAVPGRLDELQLVAPDAQLLWSEPLEARVRSILTELVAPDAPGRITGVREIIHVPGNLAGEGETQIFLTTSDRSAASMTVRHRPGDPPRWGASFSELVADVANPPSRDTLAWYRLACFLPHQLPSGANHSETAAARAQAEADYRMVLGELGSCRRTRQ
ncbi:MAG: hypothetical protein H6917_12575 [Novosphingobium sp.]|nr:hypothetical protein [Novosphingobium sp.]MCP5403205.1 hypothetical protein [Novosphingobium sp.]